MYQNYHFIAVNIVATLHFWTIFIPIFDSFIDVTKNISPFLEKFVIFMAVTDSHFLWHIFSLAVKWLFIMNFVSNCQFFLLERCNKVGTVALASLAGAITAILIATKVIAGPASLALVASPAGIAALFVVAAYFAALAFSSYQQMNAIENAKGEKGDRGEQGLQGEKGDKGEQGLQGEKGEALDLASELQKPDIMKIFEDKFQGKTAS